MKKWLKYLFSALIVFGIAFNVYAEEGEKYDVELVVEESGYGYDSGISYGVSGHSDDANVYKYVFSNKEEGKEAIGYCLEPERNNGTGSGSRKASMTVSEVMNENNNKYNAGVAAIIAAGCNTVDCSYDEYVATSYALRAYSLGLFGKGRSFPNKENGIGNRHHCADYNLGIEWANANSQSLSANPSYSTMPSECKDYVFGGSTFNYEENSHAATILARAQELFNAGVNAAADYKENPEQKTTEVKVDLIPKEIDVSPESTDETETKSYEVGIKVTVKDFSARKDDSGKLVGKLTLNDIECADCELYKITFDKIKYGEQTINGETNLLDFLTESDGFFNGELMLSVTFTREPDGECVPRIAYKITYSATIPTGTVGKYEINMMESTTYDDKRQVFIMTRETSGDGDIEKKTYNKEATTIGTITCTPPPECTPGDPECDPEVEPPKCDEPSYIYNPECQGTGELIVRGPSNVKDCVLEKSDDTENNQYRLSLAKGGVSYENQFCSIHCKEDYNDIYLQNALDGVACGSGFDLNARISGTKMCYTAGKGTYGKDGLEKYEIDVARFGQIITSIQKSMIEQFNVYDYNRAGYQGIVQKDPDDKCTCKHCEGGDTYSWGWHVENTPYTEYTYRDTIKSEDKPKYGIHIYELHANPKVNSDKGACSATTVEYTPCPEIDLSSLGINGPLPAGFDMSKIAAAAGISCGCKESGTCSDSNPTFAQQKANYKKNMDKAADALAKLEEAYAKAVGDILECTQWANNPEYDYDFLEDLIIRYYYNEHQGNNEYYTPYYDIIRNNLNEEEIVLEEIKDKAEQSKEVRYWIGDTPGDGVEDTYEAGGTTNSSAAIRDDYNFAFCTTAGCVNTPTTISRATFVKRSNTNKKEYQLPTQFYDTGSVYSELVYSEFEMDINEGVPLEHQVPVTFNACIGGEFDLIIENLGEYYYGEGYGRLVDCQATSEDGKYICSPAPDNVVADFLRIDNPDLFDGRYICNYNTDCDCEDEKIECDPTFGGTYYYANDGCEKVEIQCCDIYSTTYDRDNTTLKNNKYICSLDNKQYDTLVEAKAACTVTREKTVKYQCPNGETTTLDKCYIKPEKYVNDSDYTCSSRISNYTLKKENGKVYCEASPTKDLSYCPDGYLENAEGKCFKVLPITETDNLHSANVGVVIAECTTPDGRKINYSELSRKFTCDVDYCDSDGGTFYYKSNDECNNNICIDMECCTGDTCIHNENGKDYYYKRSKLTRATDKSVCDPDECTPCEPDGKINYYYIDNGKNQCVSACYSNGKYYDSDGNVISKPLTSLSGKSQEEISNICNGGGKNDCVSLPWSSYLYAFTFDGGIACPSIECCYLGSTGNPTYCKASNPAGGLYQFNSLEIIEDASICNGGGNDPCKDAYSGKYRDIGTTNCFDIKCCTDENGNDNICKSTDNEIKFADKITPVNNELLECGNRDNECNFNQGGTYKYKNTEKCISIKCCYETYCLTYTGEKEYKNDIVKVTNESEECPNVCLEEYGGIYGIPHDDGCIECVNIKCCESNSANAICYDYNDTKYNLSGLTYVEDESRCSTSCTGCTPGDPDCPNECTPGDPDCPDPGCPNCSISCGPSGCEIVPPPHDCPLCNFKCFNCIFNNGSFNLTTKQISTTVMQEIANGSSGGSTTNPLSLRHYGYNWITNSYLQELNIPDELKAKMERITDKATTTIGEIGENGETIYDGGKDTDSSTLGFSIEMTPAVANTIKKYNQKEANNGGYGNESLKCYHDKNEDEVNYPFVYCYSTFLDELYQEHGSKMTFSAGRIFDPDSRLDGANSDNYWTLWDGVYNENAIGGPAWK